jgi:hypothetical protein
MQEASTYVLDCFVHPSVSFFPAPWKRLQVIQQKTVLSQTADTCSSSEERKKKNSHVGYKDVKTL